MNRFLGIFGTRLAQFGKFALGAARYYGPRTMGRSFAVPERKTSFRVFRNTYFEVPERQTAFRVPIEN